MSALPPTADMAQRSWDVRFVPKADIERATRRQLPHGGAVANVLQPRRLQSNLMGANHEATAGAEALWRQLSQRKLRRDSKIPRLVIAFAVARFSAFRQKALSMSYVPRANASLTVRARGSVVWPASFCPRSVSSLLCLVISSK